MARKNFNAFLKKQKAEEKRKKKAEKAAKMEERKEDDKSGKLSDMMAYLDEDGNIVEEPVDDLDKKIEEKVENQKRQ